MNSAKSLLPVACLVIVLSCGGSGDDSGEGDAGSVDSIAYRIVPNAALYWEADYEGMLLEVKSNMNPESCQAICTANSECTFFYFNARGSLDLPPLSTDPFDCAFFRGKLWAGEANHTDSYVKTVNGKDAWDLAPGSL
jgi:hypothetical protein